MPPLPPPMHPKVKPIVNTVAVEMGSVDACPSPLKHPQTDLLTLYGDGGPTPCCHWW